MSRKLLITSGCSWTAGSSRMNQKYVWPIILAKKLDMDCVNVGKGGVGNEYIYNRIIDKLCTTKRIGLAICLWTDFDRWDFYSSTFQLQPKFRHGELFNLEKSIRWIHAFQNHCQLKDIPFLQMQSLPPTEDVAPSAGASVYMKGLLKTAQFDLIDRKKFVGWPMYRELGGSTIWEKLDEVDPDWIKLRVSKEDLHPNDKGHDYIAEILYDAYKKIYL